MPPRRPNGSGSVYRMPGNRAKPWRAMITIGRDIDGQLVRKSVGTYRTKAEAELAVGLRALNPGSVSDTLTLADVFARWKLTRAYTDLSKQGKQSYDAAWHYFRQFHGTRFRDIRTPHWQNAIDLADELGRSRSTMTKIKTLAGILSAYAMSIDVVSKDYHATVRLPRKPKGRRVKPTFSQPEIDTLFSHVDEPLVDTILILIYTGARIRELLQLRYDHVDLEQQLIIGGMKSEAGTDRIIPIHPKILPLIERRMGTAQTHLIEYDREIGNARSGTKRTIRAPYRYEFYFDQYMATLKRLGIRPLTPHKARHTFFTRFYACCQDRKAIALIGGHSDPAFTEREYVQPDIDRLRSAIEQL